MKAFLSGLPISIENNRLCELVLKIIVRYLSAVFKTGFLRFSVFKHLISWNVFRGGDDAVQKCLQGGHEMQV